MSYFDAISALLEAWFVDLLTRSYVARLMQRGDVRTRIDLAVVPHHRNVSLWITLELTANDIKTT